MLSDYERRTIDEIEASLARDRTRRRARRAARIRAVRLAGAVGMLLASVCLTGIGLLAPLPGVLVATTVALSSGWMLTDATRQWRIEIRLRQHLNRAASRRGPGRRHC